MAHAIPVSVSGLGGLPLPDDLAADIFWVTSDGDIIEQFDRVAVHNGVAVYGGPPLGGSDLRWAIMIRDLTKPGAIFRSGPLRRLPGPPSLTHATGQISIFRCGRANLQLPEIAPRYLAVRLQHLPAPLQFVGVDLGSDAPHHYIARVRGRLKRPLRTLPFTYQRTLRLVPGNHPGRPERVVEPQLEGTGTTRGADVGPYAPALDTAIATAVSTLFGAAALHVVDLCLLVGGGRFKATTASATAVSIEFPPDTTAGTEGYLTVAGGAVTGTVLDDHAPPATIS